MAGLIFCFTLVLSVAWQRIPTAADAPLVRGIDDAGNMEGGHKNSFYLIVADPIRAGHCPLENWIGPGPSRPPNCLSHCYIRANQRDRLGSAESARTGETVGHGPRRFAKLLASREENYGEEN
jgi:hypothetical protein